MVYLKFSESFFVFVTTDACDINFTRSVFSSRGDFS